MQKTVVFIIIATLLSLLLFGCRQEEGVGTVTAVAVATTPPTATSSPTVVVTETAVPTATNTPEPTPPSPLAEISDLTTLSAISIDVAASYKLQTPSYDFMYDWLSAARETPNRRDDLLIYYTANLLSFDFARNYPTGKGSLEDVVANIEKNGMELFFFPELWTVLQTAIVAHLNQNQIHLENDIPIDIPAATLLPHAVDLDGDGIEEWLVKVESNHLRILGVIPLSAAQSKQYTILPNTIEPIDTRRFDYIAQANLDLDFTDDENEDLLLAKLGYLGGPVGDINIYTWNGSGLYLLEEIDISTPRLQPTSIFSIVQLTPWDRHNAFDVQVTTPHFLNLACEWYETDICSWSNSQALHNLQDQLPPDKPECLFFHAITPHTYYSQAILEEFTRLELLERGLSKVSLETVPSADYLALVYVHLSAAYSAQWDDLQAQQTISHIYDLPEDAPFVNLVKEFYEEEGEDVIRLCKRLYSEPELAEDTDISNYIHQGSVIGFFGPGSELINADAVCPYPRLISERLSAISLPVNQHPATSLNQFGYTFSQYESFNLDADDALEWIGIVQGNDAHMTILDEVDGVLKPVLLRSICTDCDDALMYELRQDEQDIYIIGRWSSYQPTCTSNTELVVHNSPFFIQATEDGFDFSSMASLCSGEMDERPLSEITYSDFFPEPSYTPPQWRWITFDGTEKAVWEWVEEIQTAVLTQTDPDIANKITDLLNYLPSDDPEAQPYREHLTYLLGYHHELIGAEEEAVSTYLDLIQQNPSSPWSWLAWARLEPVEE